MSRGQLFMAVGVVVLGLCGLLAFFKSPTRPACEQAATIRAGVGDDGLAISLPDNWHVVQTTVEGRVLTIDVCAERAR